MILWCEDLSERLVKAEILNDLMPRFVDDITLLPEVIDPGMKLVDGKLEYFEDCVDEDEKVDDDRRTMNIISDIANNICEDIQVTYNVPSN